MTKEGCSLNFVGSVYSDELERTYPPPFVCFICSEANLAILGSESAIPHLLLITPAISDESDIASRSQHRPHNHPAKHQYPWPKFHRSPYYNSPCVRRKFKMHLTKFRNGECNTGPYARAIHIRFCYHGFAGHPISDRLVFSGDGRVGQFYLRRAPDNRVTVN